MDQKQAIRDAHNALLDYMQFLRAWSSNNLDNLRLITNIGEEIQSLNETIYELEKEFPHVDPDNINYN